MLRVLLLGLRAIGTVQAQLTSYFPQLISYERFVTRMTRQLPGIFVLLKWLCVQGLRTGFYIVDSKPLAVCDNHRIHSNKVFADLAARGKSSMGWFMALRPIWLSTNMANSSISCSVPVM